jgi:hypothetical protein
LLHVLENENDEQTKGHLCWSIHSINNRQGFSLFISILEDMLKNDSKPLLRMTASLCLVDILSKDAPDEAKESVIELHILLTSGTISQLPPHYEEIHRIIEKIR